MKPRRRVVCSRLCPIAPLLDWLRGMEIWWLADEKHTQSHCKTVESNSEWRNNGGISLWQNSTRLLESAVTAGGLPSANTAVNKKVSAWLQQSYNSDNCTQGSFLFIESSIGWHIGKSIYGKAWINEAFLPVSWITEAITTFHVFSQSWTVVIWTFPS